MGATARCATRRASTGRVAASRATAPMRRSGEVAASSTTTSFRHGYLCAWRSSWRGVCAFEPGLDRAILQRVQTS